MFKSIYFKIRQLSEDTLYKLKILRSSLNNIFYSSSDLIGFRTLKSPSIKVAYVNNTSVHVTIKIKCYHVLFNHNSKANINLPKGLRFGKLCKYFTLSWNRSGNEVRKTDKTYNLMNNFMS